MKRWEYAVIHFDGHNEKQFAFLLNVWGQDGWELVVVIDTRMTVFKRELSDEKASSDAQAAPVPAEH